MFHKIINTLDRFSEFDTVSAHCDIPCKIYDPISAQIAALTVIRMVDLIGEIGEKAELSLNDQAQLARLVAEKEQHAAKVKEEVRIIWGDYFKQPQIEQFPSVHELVHGIMMQASKCKQHIDREAALALLEQVNQFADMFWQSKGMETYRSKAPYLPGEPVVYPKLAAE